MNLELLDPFGRQVPDRIDSTLDLPAPLHFRAHDGNDEKKIRGNIVKIEETEWKSAFHVAFNRRGTYVAVGYGSGTVAVHNVLSRTLSALYRNENVAASPSAPGMGISNVSWSRRSRTLLAGSLGDATIRLFDTTHPFGSEEASRALLVGDPRDNEDDVSVKEFHVREERVVNHTFEQTQHTSFADLDERFFYLNESISLKPITVPMGQEIPAQDVRVGDIPSDARRLRKYPSITVELPQKVGGSMQVNPRVPTGGLVVLEDGSLNLFWEHPSIWVGGDDFQTADVVLVPIWKDASQPITCAAFDPRGNRVYAATKTGKTFGFDVTSIWSVLLSDPQQLRRVPTIEPHFDIKIPGASAAWHLLVSRNGKFFVINSADGAIRLFSTEECWERPGEVEKPTWVFQDVVSKVKFASCDLSGDGEYVVGGTNGEDFKYQLYIWNTSTGVLMDKLTGPSVQLYSVAWHPTRSFIAVATADGLVDVWGPHIDWTNFAPDFQALPMNVEYVEGEDELDVDKDGKYLADVENEKKMEEDQNEKIDVCSVDPAPVFASDSEKEEEVFFFETKVRNLLAGRRVSKVTAMEE